MEQCRIRTVEDIIAEEEEERRLKKERSRLADKNRLITEERRSKLRKKSFISQKKEKRISDFISCFNTGWKQIAFMLLYYSPKPIGSENVLRQFKKILGKEGDVPQNSRHYLLKFVESGFAKKKYGRKRELFSISKKGMRYAAPAIERLMSWSLVNRTPSHIGLGKAWNIHKRERPSYFSYRILKVLKEKPFKRINKKRLASLIGISLGDSINHINLLKKEGMIEYNSVSSRNNDGRTWLTDGEWSAYGAITNKKLRLNIGGIDLKKPILELMAKRGKKGVTYKELNKEYNLDENETRTCSFLVELRRERYAESLWKGGERLSEARITHKGLSFIEITDKIFSYPLSLNGLQTEISSKNEFKEHGKALSVLYYPYSKSYKRWLGKMESLKAYLREKERVSTFEIYKNTWVKTYTPLRKAIKEGIVEGKRLKKGGKTIYTLITEHTQ